MKRRTEEELDREMSRTIVFTVIAFLFGLAVAASTAFGQSFGTFTISSTAAANAESAVNVEGHLIDAPDAVPANRTFLATLKGDLPYQVDPAGTAVVELLDRNGNVVLFVTTADSDITITVSHQVVHPTEAELAEAPLDDRAKFIEWMYRHSTDEIYQDSRTVTVGDGPDPEPDPDPDPDPDPEPEPDDPAPIPEDGFRVMVIFENGENRPEYLRSITAGRAVSEYLEKTCVEEPNGWAGFRFVDPHEDLSDDPQADIWVPAMKRERDSLPWLIISNGKTGYEGPLPKSVPEFLEKCRKYEVD